MGPVGSDGHMDGKHGIKVRAFPPRRRCLKHSTLNPERQSTLSGFGLESRCFFNLRFETLSYAVCVCAQFCGVINCFALRCANVQLTVKESIESRRPCFAFFRFVFSFIASFADSPTVCS